MPGFLPLAGVIYSMRRPPVPLFSGSEAVTDSFFFRCAASFQTKSPFPVPPHFFLPVLSVCTFYGLRAWLKFGPCPSFHLQSKGQDPWYKYFFLPSFSEGPPHLLDFLFFPPSPTSGDTRLTSCFRRLFVPPFFLYFF